MYMPKARPATNKFNLDNEDTDAAKLGIQITASCRTAPQYVSIAREKVTCPTLAYSTDANSRTLEKLSLEILYYLDQHSIFMIQHSTLFSQLEDVVLTNS